MVFTQMPGRTVCICATGCCTNRGLIGIITILPPMVIKFLTSWFLHPKAEVLMILLRNHSNSGNRLINFKNLFNTDTLVLLFHA